MQTDSKTQKLAAAAVVGAAYAVLTMALAPISYGQVQFRISEVLCILPYFLPFTAWGLFAGCAIANLISSAGVLDIVFGSLATLIAGLCTAAIGKHGNKADIWRCVCGCLMPVIWNGLIVGGVLTWVSGVAKAQMPALFAVIAAQVAGGEAAVLLVLGLPCMKLLPQRKFFADVIAKYK